MAHSRFTNVDKMLKDYNFASENAISSDCLCTICNKILINAQCAPCGCRYCLDCISAYLDGEDKYCPGNTEDCKIDSLNINNNIHIDQPMNMKISRLKVKCPEGQCNERVELRKLEDHIRVCNWRSTDCPFSNVGCKNVQMTTDKMDQHILSENPAHTKLLMDCIDIMRNEFGQMREEMREDGRVAREDMRDAREELRDTREEIRELKAKMKEMEAEVRETNELKAEVKKFKTEMKEMREEVREMNELKAEVREMKVEAKGNQIVIDELRAVIAQQSCEIDMLGEEMVALGNANRQMKDQINGLGTKMESYEAANLEMRNDRETQMSEMMVQMNAKLAQMELKGSNVDVKIDGLEERVIAMAAEQNQLNYGEFVWPIDNFADKRRNAQNGIFSKQFFSHKNGYKMCLSVDTDGCAGNDGKGTHLGVFFYLMRGPFDDILEWPFKYDVTIGIINQQSRLNHISKTFRYDNSQLKSLWEKPKEHIIYVDGHNQLIKLDQLMSDISLCGNDRIFIKCTVQLS